MSRLHTIAGRNLHSADAGDWRPTSAIGDARYTTAIAAWNLFGATDLVLAIAFGITSAEGSPLQLFSGPGSEAMQHARWSFVPTVLVPIWLILHAIIAVQLRRAQLGQAASAVA